MTDSTAETLQQFALFADLSRPQIEAVVHTFDEQVFPEGQRVLREGLSGSSFYVILEGEAAVVVDGQERSRLGRGEFFGEISAFTGQPPIADVTATTMLRTLVIPSGELDAFLLEHPSVMLRMLHAEARRLQAASQWRQ